MKIKYDQKVIIAVRAGLTDGIMHHTLNLPIQDKYYTKKESTAYRYAISVGDNALLLDGWKNGLNDIRLLEIAIKENLISPIGWKISRHIDSNFVPFIEDV